MVVALATLDTSRTKLSQIREELACACSLEELKVVRDRAEALRVLCGLAGAAREIQAEAAELRVRSERRLGELLASVDLPRRGRGEYPRNQNAETSHQDTFPPTLEELGISRTQSSRWQQIASLPEALFESHLALNRTSGDGISSAGLLRLARKVKPSPVGEALAPVGGDAQSLEALIASKRRFACILADPPWDYANVATRAAAENHYPTIAIDDIASLPIAELAEEDAFLHLWVTSSFLFEAQFIIESWGFEYRSSFVWVKPQIGPGNYWRVSHEFLLLGVRGKPQWKDHSLRSWTGEPRRKHSAKPEFIRSAIEGACEGPYLELFARESAKGWTTWGTELKPEVRG